MENRRHWLEAAHCVTAGSSVYTLSDKVLTSDLTHAAILFLDLAPLQVTLLSHLRLAVPAARLRSSFPHTL